MGRKRSNTESVCCSLLPHSAWYGVGGWGTRGAWWPAVDWAAFGIRLEVVENVVAGGSWLSVVTGGGVSARENYRL